MIVVRIIDGCGQCADAIAAGIARVAAWFDLTGCDGRLSFTKVTTWLVLAGGTFGKLAVVLGIAVIASSYGLKGFMAFLSRSSFTGSSADARQTSEVTIRHVHDAGA